MREKLNWEFRSRRFNMQMIGVPEGEKGTDTKYHSPAKLKEGL